MLYLIIAKPTISNWLLLNYYNLIAFRLCYRIETLSLGNADLDCLNKCIKLAVEKIFVLMIWKILTSLTVFEDSYCAENVY